MATSKRTCSTCGSEEDAVVGQTIGSRGLAFWVSLSCSKCGARIEADGGEDTPDDVRAAILAEGGLWALHVDAHDASAKLAAVAALRPLLGLSIAETSALKARLPCEVATGTNAEMEHLRRQLGENGVPSRLALRNPGRATTSEAIGNQAPELHGGSRLTLPPS